MNEIKAKKILIVEDDEKSLYLARFILEKDGYEVIEARDGLDALDKVSKETPHLILMQIFYSEKNNIQLKQGVITP